MKKNKIDAFSKSNNQKCSFENPLITCLCVTENRPAFMPWLLWNFDRQTWPNKELVIIDSSPEPFRIEGRDDIRIIAAPTGTGVAAKRNLALAQARGEIVSWFDDDDWQHPDKLAWIAEALNNGAIYAGSGRGWYVDLNKRMCAPYYDPTWQVIFNSTGFRKASVASIRFREKLKRASDTPWMRDVVGRFRDKGVILEDKVMFFWLCHKDNLSNPANGKNFPERLERLRRVIGPEAWGDTDDALNQLQKRLKYGSGGRTSPNLSAHKAAESKPTKPSMRKDKNMHEKKEPFVESNPPKVGLMIKATVLDAPFLDVMARHMISQTRYPFSEKVVIVDNPPYFKGKYRSRPRSDQVELDKVLESLLADGIVDQVRKVDYSESCMTKIMERYFGNGASRIPTHAATGGPIYPTLFGMESMATDLVLQMDGDVFFHTGSSSWVEKALELMALDPSLWLMMTHPGPPAGPPGQSLGVPNVRRAVWDEGFGIWRFKTATTRYFLCDRQKLHHQLEFVPMRQGCAPLEQIISKALQRHGAFRGNLGDLKSWHLHAWSHGDPFPAWAPVLATCIEAGAYPARQRGKYDLRLDLESERREWDPLLQRFRPQETTGAESASDPDHGVAEKNTKPERTTQLSVNKTAPIAVVIPVRNRAGNRITNALTSLGWQSAGRPVQVIVVSYGSRPEIDKELSACCAAQQAMLICTRHPSLSWNKPHALNIGIRATLPDVQFVMVMDADMILAPDFLTAVLDRFKHEPSAFVLCRSSDLPSGLSLPNDPSTLENEFPRLKKTSKMRPRWGTGGIQAARRSFFFDVRGYDQDLLWWGAMDTDMMQRAKLAGLTVEWIENQTTMLHQWHPRKHTVLENSEEIGQAKKAWLKNHDLVRSRSKKLRRNNESWGEIDGKHAMDGKALNVR